MQQWTCPACGATTTQPQFVSAVGHECPKRTDPRRKVASFVRIAK